MFFDAHIMDTAKLSTFADAEAKFLKLCFVLRISNLINIELDLEKSNFRFHHKNPQKEEP